MRKGVASSNTFGSPQLICQRRRAAATRRIPAKTIFFPESGLPEFSSCGSEEVGDTAGMLFSNERPYLCSPRNDVNPGILHPFGRRLDDDRSGSSFRLNDDLAVPVEKFPLPPAVEKFIRLVAAGISVAYANDRASLDFEFHIIVCSRTHFPGCIQCSDIDDNKIFSIGVDGIEIGRKTDL